MNYGENKVKEKEVKKMIKNKTEMETERVKVRIKKKNQKWHHLLKMTKRITSLVNIGQIYSAKPMRVAGRQCGQSGGVEDKDYQKIIKKEKKKLNYTNKKSQHKYIGTRGPKCLFVIHKTDTDLNL